MGHRVRWPSDARGPQGLLSGIEVAASDAQDREIHQGPGVGGIQLDRAEQTLLGERAVAGLEGCVPEGVPGARVLGLERAARLPVGLPTGVGRAGGPAEHDQEPGEGGVRGEGQTSQREPEGGGREQERQVEEAGREDLTGGDELQGRDGGQAGGPGAGQGEGARGSKRAR